MSTNNLVYDTLVGDDPSLYQRDYEPADAVASFHTLPRFSHSGDISLLFSDDPDEVRDYAFGLLFVACLVISFFSIWGFILLLFKCLGRKRVGFLSGHAFAENGWKEFIGRCLFLFSAIIVWIFSILLVTKGVTGLETTRDTIDSINQDAIKIHDELLGITSNLQSVARVATPVRDQLVEFLENDICPLNPASDTERQVRILGKQTLSAMNQLHNFIDTELKDINGAMEEVLIATNKVDNATDNVDFTGPLSVLILVPFLIVPTFLIVALIFSWCELYYETYDLFVTWFIMPIFILMIMFAFVASAFGALGTEGNADFCSGGVHDTPENTIEMILSEYDQTSENFYYNSITFYSNQCQTDTNPWQFLQVYHDQLNEAQKTLDDFATAIIRTTVEQLSQECGASFGPTLQLINQLRTYTSILSDSSDRSIALMSCRNIVPLYTTAVYDGVCNTCITAATWIFAGFFVIAFFGSIMIMLRGSIYPVGFFGDEEDDESKADIGTGSSEEEEEEGDGQDDLIFVEEDETSAGYEGSTVGESEYAESHRQHSRMLNKINSDGETVDDVSHGGSRQTSSVFDEAESQYTDNLSEAR